MKSLSQKFLIHTLLVAFFSMLLISSYHVFNFYKTLQKNQFENLQKQSELLGSIMHSKIEELKNDVRFISYTPPIQGIIRANENQGNDLADNSSIVQWNERLTTIFKELLKAKSHYSQVRYIGIADQGKELVRVDRNQQGLIRVVEGEQLQSKGHRDYFKETIQTPQNTVYLSEFSLNTEFGKISRPYQLVLRASVPIYSDGKIFGLVIINMDYTKTFNNLNKNITEEQRYFIIDSSEKILLHSDRNFKNIHNERIIKLSEQFPKIHRFFNTNHSSSEVAEQGEVHFIKKIQYHEGYPERFLAIILSANESYIQEQLLYKVFSSQLVLFFVIIIVLLISYFFVQRLVKPVLKLKSITTDLSKGNTIDISKEDIDSIEPEDDIGVLTKTLLSMSQSILEKNMTLKFQKEALDATSIVEEIDQNNKLLYANNNFYDTTGFSQQELIGEVHHLVSPTLNDESLVKEVQMAISKGQIWHGEVLNIKKNQQNYWADTAIVPFANEHNQITKFISIKKDITDKKEQEKQLHAATEAKSKFLATMSHEIRTPLNGVLGMISLLEDEKLSSEGKSYLRTIKKSGDALITLINDILDFSKLEAGKMTVENVVFSPLDALKQTMSLLHQSAKKKNIQLSIDCPEDLLPTWVRSDITRLRQVLSNLLSNAIKFTSKDGKIKISFEHEMISQNSCFIIFHIKDDGIGISEDSQKTLFSVFTQADASTTRNYGGTGLGLAICKEICKVLKGDIWVESKEGKGSTFSFKIQVEIASEPQTQTNILISHEDLKQVSEIKKLRILVADDNNINQVIAKKFLAKLGYSCDVVSDGNEVIEALELKSYDVVLMDSHMPELDGHDATKKIRKIYKHKSKPWIIAVTASVSKEDEKKCYESGMNDFLPKPMGLMELKDALERVNNLDDQ